MASLSKKTKTRRAIRDRGLLKRRNKKARKAQKKSK